VPSYLHTYVYISYLTYMRVRSLEDATHRLEDEVQAWKARAEAAAKDVGEFRAKNLETEAGLQGCRERIVLLEGEMRGLLIEKDAEAAQREEHRVRAHDAQSILREQTFAYERVKEKLRKTQDALEASNRALDEAHERMRHVEDALRKAQEVVVTLQESKDSEVAALNAQVLRLESTLKESRAAYMQQIKDIASSLQVIGAVAVLVSLDACSLVPAYHSHDSRVTCMHTCIHTCINENQTKPKARSTFLV
jgi:chromosome segregation ATPase